MFHVYPLNDERDHVLEGTACWCQPEVQWMDPDTNLPWASGDGPLVIHNAADCRELVEEAERIAERSAHE